MADLALLPGIVPNVVPGGLHFTALADPADTLTWWEPAPAAPPPGAALYDIMLSLGAIGSHAPFLFTVEMDVAPEHQEEVDTWYAEEHLPLLAAVPGTLSARRFMARDPARSPRFLAAYRLENASTVDDAGWVAARETEWTRRCMPHLANFRPVLRRLAG
jgi:hypothetical protein